MEKLLLKKSQPAGRGQHVRLDNEILQKVAKLAGETGYSIKKLLGILVLYALANTEIQENDEDEDYSGFICSYSHKLICSKPCGKDTEEE